MFAVNFTVFWLKKKKKTIRDVYRYKNKNILTTLNVHGKKKYLVKSIGTYFYILFLLRSESKHKY